MKNFDTTDYLFLTVSILIFTGIMFAYHGAKYKDGSMFMIGIMLGMASLFPLSGAWNRYRRIRNQN